MRKLLGLLLLLLPAPAMAAVYKCVGDGQATYSASPCGSNAEVLSTRQAEPPAPPAGGKLTLYLGADHSYRAQGAINGRPVEFVVDTGASSTVIAQRVAEAAGIRGCTWLGYTATANGMVSSCVATVPSLSFGVFRVDNLMVTILPDLNVDGLLGMDVLRKMKVEQRGDVMYISN